MVLWHKCLNWVRRVGFVMSAVRPVYPEQQTFSDAAGTPPRGKARMTGRSFLKDARAAARRSPASCLLRKAIARPDRGRYLSGSSSASNSMMRPAVAGT